ncbi:MAG: hypothetical protein WKG07_29745 [Hymenobacter sp.]
MSGLERPRAFGRARNFANYRNSLADTSKFDLVYDSTTINVVSVHAEVLYSASGKGESA